MTDNIEHLDMRGNFIREKFPNGKLEQYNKIFAMSMIVFRFGFISNFGMVQETIKVTIGRMELPIHFPSSMGCSMSYNNERSR